ncbi:TRAP transporter large permease [Ruania zhangjianzhongii]|uniref:TRAP transporter large permease n=1 Tax=Ruania zhangjianzhongii TaxID=2603206 RepID=UPI0011C869FB|nr:TRAP transporter large permease [Ruania zhangjianzhongii]
MTILLIILGVLLLLVLGVPVAFALLLPTFVYFAFEGPTALTAVIPSAVGGINSFPLVALPLFILMGVMANETGVTDKLFDAAEKYLGHFRGSLGYVNIAVSLGFSWMSGSAVADAAALGRIEVPAMLKRGYPERFSTGVTAASGIIGPIMPPSIPAVLYAVAASVSLGGLLIAGILPALLLVVLLSIYVFIWARKRPELRSERATARQVGMATLHAIPALMAPVILIGGILGGIFTPTEASGIAVAYLLVLGFVTRKLQLKGLIRALTGAARNVGAILILVASAAVFARVMTLEGLPRLMTDTLAGISDSPTVFLGMTVVILLLAGMLLEPASALLIFVPVLLPAATIFGVDPLHFGSVVILSLMVGLVTPPVGLICYVLSDVTNVPVSSVFRGVAPFYIPLMAALLLVTFVPAITLTLPRALGF